MGRSAAGRALELPVEARGAALGAALGLYVAGGALALWAAARAVRRGLRERGLAGARALEGAAEEEGPAARFGRACGLAGEGELEGLRADLRAQLEEGLKGASATDKTSKTAKRGTIKEPRVRMLPTFVESLPSGEEDGVFWALDLGGTNFRSVRVRLQKPVKPSRQSVGATRSRSSILFGSKPMVLAREVPIPEELLTGTADALFDFMAKNLLAHAAEIAAAEEPPAAGGGRAKFSPAAFSPDIGFTFSYPCEQTSLRAGRLVKWTKGFSVTGAEGEDVVQLLQRAMKRAGCPGASIKALVNDTVGTLAAAVHKDKAAVVGMILGTGTNAAYMERLDRIEKLDSAAKASPEDNMVINCEWGNARSPAFPFVEADFEVDNISPNPGEQTFEKMVSGLYLGDLVRRSLVHLLRDGSLGEVGVSPGAQRALQTALLGSTLPTSAVSEIDSDTSSLEQVRHTLEAALKVPECPDEFCVLAQTVCASLRQRSGRMVAAGLAAILDNHTAAWGASQGKRRVVAVDGGLYEHYPRLRQAIHDGLAELLGPDSGVEFTEVSDGSGLGAALLAATALSYNYSSRG